MFTFLLTMSSYNKQTAINVQPMILHYFLLSTRTIPPVCRCSAPWRA